ncbi:EAL domain-containing protein [Mesorhizobium microcysteis]|uniref:EAL domain-containing protein n=2 Tax=Neoaquamicrobium microcysteis TaxID=2682781 RepID=A0A5D4GRC3_9HYPH|nr:EAL domain-containing protein [Mesorhizobium microcysteis]
MTMLEQLDRGISADEIGIETARHGNLVLRSAFQLIYRRDGDTLRAVAAEGFLRPFDKGMPIAPRPFLASLKAAERALVERYAVALHLANHRHIDVEGLDHVLAVGIGAGFADDLPLFLVRAEVPASRLICTFRNPSAFAPGTLSVVARTLKALGARVAIGGLVEEQPPVGAIRSLEPDIARIDGSWFRRVAESESARRLLPDLVGGFRAQGAQVLVEGIETRHQLAAALEAGVDLFQGFLLSSPLLAGTAIDTATIDLPDIFSDEANVIPLFGPLFGRA